MNVKASRQQRGWTAARLAQRCAETGAPEITTAVIANIETGRRDQDGRRRRDVTVDELVAFARALDMRPSELFADTGDFDGEFPAALLRALGRTEVQAAIREVIAGRLVTPSRPAETVQVAGQFPRQPPQGSRLAWAAHGAERLPPQIRMALRADDAPIGA